MIRDEVTEQSSSPVQRVAIVGGAGFIGGWLAQALARFGETVTVLDIEEPVPDILKQCSYRCCDVRTASDVDGAFDGFDTVYLLASLLSKRCDEDPHDGWRTNVGGTANVLNELARRPRPPRVVYFSSSMVYSSETTICPLPETAPVAGERLYDQTKLACEGLLKSFCFAYASKGVIFRFFSVYGPRGMSASKGHFIGTWLERARAGLPLVIDGDGTQTVDLLHVHDAVEACLLAHGFKQDNGEVETFNVGSGRDVQVKAIAQWIQEVNPDVRIECGPAKRHTIARRWADISKAEEILGYCPKVSPEAGVKRLFATELGGG